MPKKSDPNLILMDAGNTALTCALYWKGRVHAVYSIQNDNVPKFLRNFDLGGLKSIYKIVLCSVNPKMTDIVKKWRGRFRAFPLFEAGKDLRVHLKHKYLNINKLGIDRQVNLFGAVSTKRLPAVIFDFGTALTVDVITAKGVFEGGLIIPGPGVALQALASKAALLPKKLALPEQGLGLIGRDTASCMQAGILQGYSSMSEGLVRRFKTAYGKNLQVIATGGYAPIVASQTRIFDRVDPDWTLKSLALLYTSQI
ncbi:MAG: hypothetical protein A2Y02_01235 [Omnitrophica bacterium GWA2_52_12]|nr:MAG: hypothetical protein A2Y02_01235 [Omnitrophica bacterium GWA2_52_12]